MARKMGGHFCGGFMHICHGCILEPRDDRTGEPHQFRQDQACNYPQCNADWDTRVAQLGRFSRIGRLLMYRPVDLPKSPLIYLSEQN